MTPEELIVIKIIQRNKREIAELEAVSPECAAIFDSEEKMSELWNRYYEGKAV